MFRKAPVIGWRISECQAGKRSIFVRNRWNGVKHADFQRFDILLFSKHLIINY